MKDNINKKNILSGGKSQILFLTLATLVLATALSVSAQIPANSASSESSYSVWQIVIFAVVLGVAGVIVWSLKARKQQAGIPSKVKSPGTRRASNGNSSDATKEMEWLRKNQKFAVKKERESSAAKKDAGGASFETNLRKEKKSGNVVETSVAKEEKNESDLPIFAIRRLEPARSFDALSISDDDALMDAIEETYEESDQDVEVRELSVRILAAFKTRNSVEALTQIALYDLLANLRSKAVLILGEFDHESVFEPILLACADPTREVRAAAARGLTKLTFDRADAWARIAESNEEGRTISAARAAVESGFVDMSFERLIHQDRKYAYEAFALMALLITADETEKIFNALENHRDMNVRKAVLHTIKIANNPKALERLYSLLEKKTLPIELQEEVDRTIEEISVLAV